MTPQKRTFITLSLLHSDRRRRQNRQRRVGSPINVEMENGVGRIGMISDTLLQHRTSVLESINWPCLTISALFCCCVVCNRAV